MNPETVDIIKQIEKKQFFKKLSKHLGVLLLILVVLNIIKLRGEYQKPSTWVISQSLNSAITKQKQLQESFSRGEFTLDDLVRVSTSSGAIDSEVIKTGDNYLLSTGKNGEVKLNIAEGEYDIQMAKIPGIDFTGVPGTIKLDKGSLLLNIGLTKGSGSIKGSGELIKGSGESNLTIKLFQDKNDDGKKGLDEPTLPWAGVTIKLVKF